MERTTVLQSASEAHRRGWISACLESVGAWANARGYEWLFMGDEIFECLPVDLREKFLGQPVVLSDLARLITTRDLLRNGADCVVWADADFLIFAPDAFAIPGKGPMAFGREVWVQRDDRGRLRSSRKIHNAFFFFRKENPFLDYYIYSATAMLNRATAPVVPQFIGPKLLSVQHNLVGFVEVSSAAMFSPLVLHDILNGGGEALDLLKRDQEAPVYGANLSLSHINRDVDGAVIDDAAAFGVVEMMLDAGAV